METLKRKRTKNPELPERQVEKDEDGIVFDRDALMDKDKRRTKRTKTAVSGLRRH